MKNKLPVDSLLKFYYGHIHSHLAFCSFTLMRCTATDIKRLQILQNRALKLALSLPQSTDTDEVFLDHVHNILPVKGIVYYSMITMVKKNLQNSLPDKIPMEKTRSSRNCLLLKHGCSTQTMKNDICCAGIDIFNNLPLDIKRISQLIPFKNAVKQFLLDHVKELLTDNNFLRSPIWSAKMVNALYSCHLPVIYISQQSR